MTNDELYEAALQAIANLFSDQSVTQQECADNLKTLISEIETMLDTLE
jgi:hypothetical protein